MLENFIFDKIPFFLSEWAQLRQDQIQQMLPIGNLFSESHKWLNKFSRGGNEPPLFVLVQNSICTHFSRRMDNLQNFTGELNNIATFLSRLANRFHLWRKS